MSTGLRPFVFLELPAELRSMIYYHVYEQLKGVSKRRFPMKYDQVVLAAAGRPLRRKGGRLCDLTELPGRDVPGCKPWAQLSFACKTTYQETIAMFYDTIRFQARISLNLTDLGRRSLATTIGSLRLDLVTRFTLFVDTYLHPGSTIPGVTPHWASDVRKRCSRSLDFLKKMTSLKTLRVGVADLKNDFQHSHGRLFRPWATPFNPLVILLRSVPTHMAIEIASQNEIMDAYEFGIGAHIMPNKYLEEALDEICNLGRA